MATKKETAEAVEVVATETKKTTAKKAAKPAAEKAEKATTKKSTKKAEAADAPAEKTSAAKKTTKKADAEVTEAPKAKKTTKKAAKKVDTITIKLVRGFAHRLDNQIATCKSLGLRHIGDVTTQPDNAATKGKLAKIAHMVEIIKEA